MKLNVYIKGISVVLGDDARGITICCDQAQLLKTCKDLKRVVLEVESLLAGDLTTQIRAFHGTCTEIQSYRTQYDSIHKHCKNLPNTLFCTSTCTFCTYE